jgi:hypothetical protein
LLFLFFLPLHYHISFIPQPTKDCICATGNNTQSVPAAPFAIDRPASWVRYVEVLTRSIPGAPRVRLLSARAPPSSFAL